MNTDDTTNVQDGADAKPVEDGGEHHEPKETALEAFSKGVEAARIAEGGEPQVKAPDAAEKSPETPGATAAADPKEVKPELTPEQKAEADRKAAVDAEIKELELTEKKAERFRTLEAGHREAQQLKKEIEPLRAKAAELDQFHAVLIDTKARPEQVGNMFRLLKLSNSGDVGQMRSALKDLQTYVVELAKACGEPVPGFSPVNEHADLLQKVTEGTLTEEAAIEIIRSRATEARTNEQRTLAQQQKDRDDAAQHAEQECTNALNALGNDLSKSDPHYAHKLEQMKQNGTLRLLASFPPAQRVDKFKEAYLEQKAPTPKPKVAEMPLRPNGGSGGGGGMAKSVPTKAADAFMFGVAQAKEQGM